MVVLDGQRSSAGPPPVDQGRTRDKGRSSDLLVDSLVVVIVLSKDGTGRVEHRGVVSRCGRPVGSGLKLMLCMAIRLELDGIWTSGIDGVYDGAIKSKDG